MMGNFEPYDLSIQEIAAFSAESQMLSSFNWDLMSGIFNLGIQKLIGQCELSHRFQMPRSMHC